MNTNEIKLDAIDRFKKNVHISLNMNIPDKDSWGEKVEPADALQELLSRGVDTDVVDALQACEFEVRAYAKPWLPQDLSNKTLYIFNN